MGEFRRVRGSAVKESKVRVRLVQPRPVRVRLVERHELAHYADGGMRWRNAAVTAGHAYVDDDVDVSLLPGAGGGELRAPRGAAAGTFVNDDGDGVLSIPFLEEAAEVPGTPRAPDFLVKAEGED